MLQEWIVFLFVLQRQLFRIVTPSFPACRLFSDRMLFDCLIPFLYRPIERAARLVFVLRFRTDGVQEDSFGIIFLVVVVHVGQLFVK